MKKQLTTAVLLALTAFSVAAQQPAVTENKEGGRLVVNPFSGKPLTTEQLQREIESAKLQTQMLEEQLKQTNLTTEIGTVPLRKSVETEQAKTAIAKEQLAQKALVEGASAKAAKPMSNPELLPKPGAQAAAKAPTDNKSKKKAGKATQSASASSKKENSDAEDVPKEKTATKETKKSADKTAAAPSFPQLVSVISVGARKSAVLEYQGRTMVVEDGANTPFGPLVILGDTRANLGGRDYTVHDSTLSRFVETDKFEEPVKPGQMPTNNAKTSPTTSIPVAVSKPATSLPAPPGNGNSLPPLQLPPGVSILPPPK